MLLMLLPHSNEDELLCPHESAKNAFLKNQHLLDKTIQFTHFSFAEHVENAVRRIQLCEAELGQNMQTHTSLLTNTVNTVPADTIQEPMLNVLPVHSEDVHHLHSLQCSVSHSEFL